MVEFLLTWYSIPEEDGPLWPESTNMNTALQQQDPATTTPPPKNGPSKAVLTAHLETAPIAPPQPSPKRRLAEGKARRHQTPRSSHADWHMPDQRTDPIELLELSSR